MEILKAIELNDESIKSLRAHKFYDHADAVQMGNEALHSALRGEITIDLPAEPSKPEIGLPEIKPSSILKPKPHRLKKRSVL